MDNQSTEEIPSGEGWDWFEQPQSQDAKTIVEQRTGLDQDEIMFHFKKCFGTTSGKIVLEYMDIYCNDVKDFDPNLGFYNGAAAGFYRTGQRSFMSMIKAFLHRKPTEKSEGKTK